MNKKLYKEIAGTLYSYQCNIRTGNEVWENRNKEKLDTLIKDYLPQGSGIDQGVKLDLEKSGPNKLIFTFSFHFMDENGMYAGWRDYKLVVTPDLYSDFFLNIIGKDKQGIKDYFYNIFDHSLRQDIDYTYPQ